ncbi:MAG: AAA family ATPase, partial [Nitrososphaera sp.]|nr:AAA family ATPase [Nitrososphaera sp.]
MSLSITVTVSTVYPGPAGGAIFLGKDTDGNSHRFIAKHDTIFRPPLEGEVWTLKGTLRQHPQYGLQVHVESGILNKPSGKLIIDYLINHQAFRGIGIGKKKTARLWEEFGEELYAILSNGDVAKLSTVLTDNTTIQLVEAWKEASEEAEIIPFLSKYGFDVRLANKIRRVWPEGTMQKIQDNPYRMLAFADWKKVDQMARSFGISKDDSRRQVAAVEAFLYRRLEAKHTVTPREIALKGISTLLGVKNGSDAQTAIDRAVNEYAIVPFNSGYQPLGAAVMEKTIAERFRSMLAGTTSQQLPLFSNNLDTIIAESIESFEKSHDVQLNPEQRAGVEMALKSPLSVLMGGAGTGKTMVLKVIHEICGRIGPAIIQMALSGRAAQRMREATGREASTIAGFLHAARNGKINPESEPLVIIDESSMLSLPLMYSIVQALP